MRLSDDYRRHVAASLSDVPARTWLDYAVDRIYIIGDFLDPTSGPSGRLSWLASFILYGLLSVSLVDSGAWNFGHLLNGVAWLSTAFIGSIIIGTLRRVNRRLSRLRTT